MVQDGKGGQCDTLVLILSARDAIIFDQPILICIYKVLSMFTDLIESFVFIIHIGSCNNLLTHHENTPI